MVRNLELDGDVVVLDELEQPGVLLAVEHAASTRSDQDSYTRAFGEPDANFDTEPGSDFHRGSALDRDTVRDSLSASDKYEATDEHGYSDTNGDSDSHEDSDTVGKSDTDQDAH